MKYVFVPISTIGCGKSTTFRILTQLYPGWAHVENDDCKSKREFLGKLTEALQTHNVVLLDRNNHQKLHRQQIIETFKRPGVMLVALEFVDATVDRNRLRSTTFDRVDKRGDNHQTIAGNSQKGLARSIMNRFLNEFCPLGNSGFDAQFDYRLKMDMGPVSSLTNADIILRFLADVSAIPDVPPQRTVEELFHHSLRYRAKQSHREAKATKKTDVGQTKTTHNSGGNGPRAPSKRRNLNVRGEA